MCMFQVVNSEVGKVIWMTMFALYVCSSELDLMVCSSRDCLPLLEILIKGDLMNDYTTCNTHNRLTAA